MPKYRNVLSLVSKSLQKQNLEHIIGIIAKKLRINLNPTLNGLYCFVFYFYLIDFVIDFAVDFL